MRLLKYFSVLIPLLLAIPLQAQKGISGKVYEIVDGNKQPLEGATVYYVNAQVGRYTDKKGQFKLPNHEGDTLIIRYISYKDDTIYHDGRGKYEIVLTTPTTLEDVEIRERLGTTSWSLISTNQVETIRRGELEKAACCNLSESFETNASIDVSSSDAATGSKEIQMLGLAGRYTQILTEQRPMTRGIGMPYGLDLIPGAWVNSIQISKGSGSVVNGYESLTGEINVEFMKPEDAPRLYVNLYGNQRGRTELNLISGTKLNANWHSMLYFHGGFMQTKWDFEDDGFLNSPLNAMVTVGNRWRYRNEKTGGRAQFGVRVAGKNLSGGQNDFDPQTDKLSSTVYGIGYKIRRVEAWAKGGKVSNSKPGRSFGNQLSGFYHDQENWFGTRFYQGRHIHGRYNFLFQDILGNSNHSIKTGVSFLADDLSETLDSIQLQRTELVPGVWGEYNYKVLEKVSLQAGFRADYHNMFGLLMTPRLHASYKPTQETVIRASIGKGYRTPNQLSDNVGTLASSRLVVLNPDLQQETGWTYGINLVQEFTFLGRDGTFSIDAYRTDFENQLVVDREDPRQVQFYNLQGRSFSNVVQVDLNHEILPGLDLRLAGKWQDVKANYGGELLRVPFTPEYRGLINIGYTVPSESWLFDLTAQFVGKQRLPSTVDNPEEFRFDEESPAFVRLNAQVTYKYRRWDWYLGGENLGNFRQQVPIIAAADPFGPYFDASMNWGPIQNRMIYAGFRFTLK